MKLILLVILSSLFGCSIETNTKHLGSISKIEPKYSYGQKLCVIQGFNKGCILHPSNFGFDDEYYYGGILHCGKDTLYAEAVVESHLEECKK